MQPHEAMMNLPGKWFGVALDALDDPWNYSLKLASIRAREWMPALCVDPYDAALAVLADRRRSVSTCGKFPVPSWLWPLPHPSDGGAITPQRMRDFVDQGGLRHTANRLKAFVADCVLPDVPVMIGVDHSATGGVIAALSEHLGAEQLSVVILDRHFDALSLADRLPSQTADDALPTSVGAVASNEYCCGNFWAHLIDDGVVLPQNLLFIGVADHPADQTAPHSRRFDSVYGEFIARGCSFFPNSRFVGNYAERLKSFLLERIDTRYLYVSVDVDVGTDRCVHAARYMDGPGLDREAVLAVARILADARRCGRFEIAGVDLMEFNMHLLGIEIEPGLIDQTMPLAIDFVETLMDCNHPAS
jgi:arginase family enzyme